MDFDIFSFNDEQKFALFYGVMLGDGCLSQYRTKEGRERFAISITGTFPDDIPFYKEILTPLLKSFGRTSVLIKKRKDCNAIDINFPNKGIFYKISEKGFPIGKKGPFLKIPKYFYDQTLLKYVVAGFMATDGSLVLTKNPNKYYPRIEANGISEKLIKQIQKYFLSIGMSGSFYLAKRKNMNSCYNVQQQYRIQFNGIKNLLIFNKQVGFVNSKHKDKYETFSSYSENYDKSIQSIPTQKQKNVRLKTLNGWGGSQTLDLRLMRATFHR